jgi:hypothetical protein
MKLPPFDHSQMEWGAWNAFHVVHKHNTFYQFDTGEFIVTSHTWHPDERRIYSDLNIQIVGTNDEDCPQLYVPSNSKPIPKSHLNHKGQQYLLLDLDHKRAVSLYPWLTKDNAPSVPERFTDKQRVAAWYAGPGAVPVGTSITRHYPQPLTMQQRSHINKLSDVCKIWLRMQPDPNALEREYIAFRDVQRKVSYFVDTPFSALTANQRMAIATHGFDMIVEEKYPYLTFDV